MDNKLKNIDFKVENFTYEYFQSILNDFKEFLYDEPNSKDKNNQILQFLIFISEKINISLSDFKGDFTIQQDVEIRFKIIFESFLREIDTDLLDLEDFQQILKIFQVIVKSQKTTLYNVNIYSMLLKLLRDNNYISKIDTTKFENLVKTMYMKFNIELTPNQTDKLEPRTLNNYKREMYSHWYCAIENFFDRLPKEQFTENLKTIQHYYEFCIKNCTRSFYDCPYKHISSKLIRIVSYFDTLPKNSIYFNIPPEENNKQKIIELIELFKTILIPDESNYDQNELENFGKQIKLLIEFKDNKNDYKIFIENYQFWMQSLFDIFKKTKKNSSRYIIRNLIPEKKIFSNIKQTELKNYNLWLINELKECSNILVDSWTFFDEQDDQKERKSCLELFQIFCRPIREYFIDNVRDSKNLCKPMLDFIIKMLELTHNEFVLLLINDFMRKENFFLLKDYVQETSQILNCFINLAFESNNKYDQIKYGIEILKEKIVNFETLVKDLQPLLFEEIVCKPIEKNISYNNLFLCTISIFNDLVVFDYYPDESKDMHRFSNLIKLINSSEIFESIQPDSDSSKQRILFYNLFFKKLGKSMFIRHDLVNFSSKPLVDLINLCIHQDNFIDEFKEEFTINFEILLSLSQAFHNPNIDENLINELISFWIFIYEKNNQQITQLFFETINHCALKHSKILAKKSDMLWNLYINYKQNIPNFTNCMSLILPYCLNEFKKNYSEKYAINLINNFEILFIENNILLYKLIDLSPQFYLQSIDKNQLLIIEMINKSIEIEKKNLLLYLMAIFYNLSIKVLEKNIFIDKICIKNLFENRKKFLKLIFKNNKEILRIENYNLDLVLLSVCNYYYFLCLNCDYDQVKLIIYELLDLYPQIKTKDCHPIFTTLKKIVEFNNRIYLNLLKEKFNYLKFIIDDKATCFEIKESVNFLIDLIEERNLQTFSTQLNQNTSSIKKINENIVIYDSKLNQINENLDKQDTQIKDLNEKVKNTNDKITKIDSKLDEHEQKIEEIDQKTLYNLPLWCNEIKAEVINQKIDWILIAKRLNFNDIEIKGWLNQIDPFMSMLQEWFIIHKTSEAIQGLLKVFKELNINECIKIIENNLEKIEAESSVLFKDKQIEDDIKNNSAQIFICYEWSSKSKAELLKKYLFESLNEGILDTPNYKIWFDDGNMGGGISRNYRIDLGLRLCKVLVCLITGETNKDQNSLNQINLAIQLNKPIIPLLLDSKLKWPPSGSLGPILSEYLFIRFFQRPPKELTNDERYWPVDKFNELTMQLRQLVPIMNPNSTLPSNSHKPEVFISYQWDKQKQIKELYQKLINFGLTCWLDIHQMAGGDSLYDKIDDGLRNCKIVISCVTTKYGLSANCRKEIALADAISRPIIPILLEKGMKYPPAGPMAPTLSVIKHIDFTNNYINNDQDILWDGEVFNELMERLKQHLPQNTIDIVTSRACIIS